MSKELAIPQEVILSKIYEIREEKVMLDSDLAEPPVIAKLKRWHFSEGLSDNISINTPS